MQTNTSESYNITVKLTSDIPNVLTGNVSSSLVTLSCDYVILPFGASQVIHNFLNLVSMLEKGTY